jgi:hypothetical protein
LVFQARYEGDVEGMGGVLFSIVVNAERIRRELVPELQGVNRIEEDPDQVYETLCTNMASYVDSLECFIMDGWQSFSGVQKFVEGWLRDKGGEKG